LIVARSLIFRGIKPRPTRLSSLYGLVNDPHHADLHSVGEMAMIHMIFPRNREVTLIASTDTRFAVSFCANSLLIRVIPQLFNDRRAATKQRRAASVVCVE